MKYSFSLSMLSFLTVFVSGCAVQPVGWEEPALNPADARAPAATVAVLTWQAGQHGGVAAPAATAEPRHGHHAHDANDTRASGGHQHVDAGNGMTTGTVTDVDRQSGRVTLDHEDIPGLMPAMQMTFDIDAELLEGLRPGMEVQFTVRQGERPGRFLVTEIEALSDLPPSDGHREEHDNHGHAH